MLYQAIKNTHIIAAALTMTGFILRTYWSVIASSKRVYRTTKILPHLIDTILLLSGMALMIQMHYSPLEHYWLAIKLVFVFLYILNGFYVLKWARYTHQKIIGLFFAVLLFTGIVSLAYFKPIIF